ncbi:hypothetical protein THITH_00680 [Thioalkalivibrio paradoxus ARh 1]|uniref:Uncharacterized protein n=1 Tax=Thioalkalivibrio paradoxus ARh 1 TaxID=713585 RepID=W0DRD5_9GAMM|nr:hypothetical protein THITH_00680 [Thioalkalivibrio paradoxus ARh 1]
MKRCEIKSPRHILHPGKLEDTPVPLRQEYGLPIDNARRQVQRAPRTRLAQCPIPGARCDRIFRAGHNGRTDHTERYAGSLKHSFAAPLSTQVALCGWSTIKSKRFERTIFGTPLPWNGLRIDVDGPCQNIPAATIAEQVDQALDIFGLKRNIIENRVKALVREVTP